MQLRAEPGTLLAASPDLLDPNFMHTVVLIAQHSDEGAYGLVVNRSAGITLDSVFPEHPLLSELAFPLSWGGPVALDTLQFLHRVPDIVPGGLELGGGVFFGGDFEALARYLHARREEARGTVRLLLGYAGWGKRQLDDELASGSWLPAPLAPDLVFGAERQATWRRVLASIGDGDGALGSEPPDVSWN